MSLDGSVPVQTIEGHQGFSPLGRNVFDLVTRTLFAQGENAGLVACRIGKADVVSAERVTTFTAPPGLRPRYLRALVPATGGCR